MNEFKKWIAKVLKIEPYIYHPFIQAIDQDEDYRGLGKSTMRLRAAYAHLNKDRNHTVHFITTTESEANRLKRLFKEVHPDYMNRIKFVTVRTRMVGSRPSKCIYDLFDF